MSPTESDSTRDAASLRRLLTVWPLTLVVLTLVLLLVAGRVTAWHGPRAHSEGAWRSHATRILDRFLDDVDASEDQITRIHAIVEQTLGELESARGDHTADLAALRALAGADRVDRGALESLRSAHLARAENASEALTTALADVLDVLTPDQRRDLVARLEDLRSHHDRHRHGHPGRHRHDHHPEQDDRTDPGDGAPDGPHAGLAPAPAGPSDPGPRESQANGGA